MNRHQVIAMLVMGALLFSIMLIPNSAQAISLQESSITAPSFTEATLDTDSINHAPSIQKAEYALSENITKTTIPTNKAEDKILDLIDAYERPKETTITPAAPEPTDPIETSQKPISVPTKTEPTQETTAVPTVEIKPTVTPTEPAPAVLTEEVKAPSVPAENEPVLEPSIPEPTVSEPVELEQPEANEDTVSVDHNDSRNDDFGDCPKCGRKLWTYQYRSGCFTFLSDSTCDCGAFVKAGQCHHH